MTEESEQYTPTKKITPTQTTPPAKPHSKTVIVTLASVFGAILLLIFGAIGGAMTLRFFLPETSPIVTSANDGNATITAEESSIASVAEKVAPSVVSIITTTSSRSYYGTTSGEAAGTGIIVSKEGYVITNNHVVENANAVSIITNTGDHFDDVKVIGRDPLNDIAFLKIQSSKTFTPATLGDSSTIRIGQQVVAIGNALGQFSNTVTSGIISGTGRPITAQTEAGATESLTDLIQTDASINPGNSGGPLVNLSGQVVGINTAIVEGANGIGFAIPINATKGVLAEVLDTGSANRSYLGVNYISITPDIAREYNLTVNRGAYIYVVGGGNPVVSGGPADKAGLQAKDIITKINDKTIGTHGSLSSVLGQYRPGEQVTITFLRDGKEQTTSVTLGTYSQNRQ